MYIINNGNIIVSCGKMLAFIKLSQFTKTDFTFDEVIAHYDYVRVQRHRELFQNSYLFKVGVQNVYLCHFHRQSINASVIFNQTIIQNILQS